MTVGVRVKSVLASLFKAIGILSWRLDRYSEVDTAVLMYHRVMPKNEACYGMQEGMYVEPETFEEHIQFLQRYFSIIRISELLDSFKFKSKKFSEKPLCVLTFDDGWYDFHKHAFPLMYKYGVPATVFLPTDFVGTRRWFWTDRLAYILFQKENSEDSTRSNIFSTHPFVRQLENINGSCESKTEKSIEMLKKYRSEEIEETLSELSEKWNLGPYPPDRAFLSWEEVREMAQSGLITFGSHTVTHRILTTLTDKEVHDELIRSKERLISEKVVDTSFIPFCYPNGNYNEKIVAQVNKTGYNLAVTTDNGWNNAQQSSPFTLRRIAIHQDMASTKAMFGCRITNIF